MIFFGLQAQLCDHFILSLPLQRIHVFVSVVSLVATIVVLALLKFTLFAILIAVTIVVLLVRTLISSSSFEVLFVAA